MAFPPHYGQARAHWSPAQGVQEPPPNATADDLRELRHDPRYAATVTHAPVELLDEDGETVLAAYTQDGEPV